ncbi:MAG: hypothetical protein ABI614_09465 [Planctomycetota bacterium]
MLPIFPELPLSGSPAELWELWERFSGFALVNAAGFTSLLGEGGRPGPVASVGRNRMYPRRVS